MTLSKKENLFFALVFCMVLVSGMITDLIHKHFSLLPFFAILIMVTIICLIILILVYNGAKVCHYDNFHFEVTPAKRCDGGPYLTQSGPDHKMCEELLSTEKGRQEYNTYNCPGGLCYGRPLNMEITSASNALYENTMCRPPILQEGQPQVL